MGGAASAWAVAFVAVVAFQSCSAVALEVSVGPVSASIGSSEPSVSLENSAPSSDAVGSSDSLLRSAPELDKVDLPDITDIPSPDAQLPVVDQPQVVPPLEPPKEPVQRAVQEERPVSRSGTRRERRPPRSEATRTHDGQPRVLALADDDQRLDVLLSLVTQCSAYAGLNEFIDDRRVRIVELRDLFNDLAIARLLTAAYFGAPGRQEAVRTVLGNENLHSVLADHGVTDSEIVALQVSETGMTEVFVLNSDDRLFGLYPVGALPVRVGAEMRCPDDQPDTIAAVVGSVAVASKLDVDQTTTGSIPYDRISAEPEQPPASVVIAELEVPGAPGTAYDVEAQTSAAAGLATLVDQVARVDALMLAVDEHVRIGVADIAASRTERERVAGLVVSSHAMAEAVARSARVEPGLTVDAAEPPPSPSGSIPTGAIASARPAVAETGGVSAAQECTSLLESLVDTPALITQRLLASSEIILVPVEGCTPDPSAREQMQSILGDEARVQIKLAAAGYEVSDILGGALDDESRLLIYVTNQEGMEPAIAFSQE